MPTAEKGPLYYLTQLLFMQVLKNSHVVMQASVRENHSYVHIAREHIQPIPVPPLVNLKSMCPLLRRIIYASTVWYILRFPNALLNTIARFTIWSSPFMLYSTLHYHLSNTVTSVKGQPVCRQCDFRVPSSNNSG